MSLSNSLGLLGRKVGMMRLFTDDGDAVPVTVVDVSNNRVTQVKTLAHDGYDALQVTFGARRASRVTKPEAGHLAKAGVEAGEIIQEFRVASDVAAQYQPGAVVAPNAIFAVGQKVDVQGTSIGKGFAGTIKRHNFKLPARIARQQPFAQCAWLHLHGPGSGSRVSGQENDRSHGRRDTKTIQNLDIVRVDETRQLLMIRGAVPGSNGGFVTVRPAIKAKVRPREQTDAS